MNGDSRLVRLLTVAAIVGGVLVLMALSGCSGGSIRDAGPTLRIEAGTAPMLVRLPLLGLVTLTPGTIFEWTAGAFEVLQPAGADESATMTRDRETGMVSGSTGKVPKRSVIAAQASPLTWVGILLVVVGAAAGILRFAPMPWAIWLRALPWWGGWAIAATGVGLILLPGLLEALVGPLAWLILAALVVGVVGLILWRTGIWRRIAEQTEDGIAAYRKRDPKAGEQLVGALREHQDRATQDHVKARRKPAERGTPGVP